MIRWLRRALLWKVNWKTREPRAVLHFDGRKSVPQLLKELKRGPR